MTSEVYSDAGQVLRPPADILYMLPSDRHHLNDETSVGSISMFALRYPLAPTDPGSNE